MSERSSAIHPSQTTAKPDQESARGCARLRAKRAGETDRPAARRERTAYRTAAKTARVFASRRSRLSLKRGKAIRRFREEIGNSKTFRARRHVSSRVRFCQLVSPPNVLLFPSRPGEFLPLRKALYSPQSRSPKLHSARSEGRRSS